MTPPTYWSFITTPASATVNNAGSYGSPPDPFGVGAVGLDQAGPADLCGHEKPGTDVFSVSAAAFSRHIPYELNLDSERRPADCPPDFDANNPFSLSELERLLRPYDRDATTLPARLAALTSPNATRATSVLLTQPNLRGTFTTESWDVPCPNVLTSVDNVGGSSTLPNETACSTSPTCLIAHGDAPIRRVGPIVAAGNVGGAEDEHQPTFRQRAGRPWQRCGRQSGGSHQPVVYPQQRTLSTFNFDGTGSLAAFGLSNNSLGARQLEARYLYVLMCLTCDLTYLNGPTAFNDATGRDDGALTSPNGRSTRWISSRAIRS